MDGVNQLALGGIKQPHLTTLGGRSYQSAIGRNRQRDGMMSPGNTTRWQVRVDQIVESYFMVVSLFDGHDQHPASRGKGCITDDTANGRYNLPGDIPGTQGIPFRRQGRQVVSILT